MRVLCKVNKHFFHADKTMESQKSDRISGDYGMFCLWSVNNGPGYLLKEQCHKIFVLSVIKKLFGIL